MPQEVLGAAKITGNIIRTAAIDFKDQGCWSTNTLAVLISL